MSRDSGSFRDPSGYVFQFEGRVFRALDRASAELLRGLDAQGHLARWAQAGLVVGTRFVADETLRRNWPRSIRGSRRLSSTTGFRRSPIPTSGPPRCWPMPAG